MIRRFKIPMPTRQAIVVAEPVTAAEPIPLETIEVEVVERDEARGTTTLRGRVPINELIVETPYFEVADDIAARMNHLRDFLLYHAQAEYVGWRENQKALWEDGL